MKNKLKFKITYSILLILITYFCIVILEIYLINTQKKNLNENTNYDTRSVAQLYYEYTNQGIDISPVIPPSLSMAKLNDDFLYLSGISNIKTILCNESGEYAYFQSDKYGFNNKNQIYNTNKVDSVLLGDSFTLGACVNPEDNIASQMSLITRSKLLNLGYSGNGPLTSMATMYEYLEEIYFTKLIYIFFEGNDLWDLKNELENSKLSTYLREENVFKNIKKYNFEKDKNLKDLIESEYGNFQLNKKQHNYINYLKLTKIRGILKKMLPKKEKNNTCKHCEFMASTDDAEKKFLIKKLGMITNKMFRFAEKKNAKLYIVYLPDIGRYKNDNINIKNFNNNLDVKKLFSKYENFIDTTIFLDQSKNPLKYYPFEREWHFNGEGYKKVSEIISKNLVSENIN
jgi:hypothetical protein